MHTHRMKNIMLIYDLGMNADDNRGNEVVSAVKWIVQSIV